MRLSLLIVVAVGCKTSEPPTVQVPSPPPVVAPAGTPAGRQFTAWLAAFNSADKAQLATYHDANFPYAAASQDVGTPEHELGLSQGTGGFEVKKLEAPTDTHAIAIMKEKRSDQFAQVELEVDAAEPHHVVKFDIHPIPTPDEFLTAEDRKARSVDDVRRRALVDGIAKQLDAHYIYPEVAAKMNAALREHLAHGDYDAITDGEAFAVRLTEDLRAVSHDKHLGVMFGRHPPDDAPEPKPEDVAAMVRRMNFGFGAIERLDGNVARVVIDGFPPAVADDSLDGIAALMSQVADADALVVDLRTNGGGSPDTVALVASYLFDQTPVHLNDMYSRDTGKITESWTLRDLRGKRFGGVKPVFVLTSARTFSGGEEFAYDLQALKRATLIGETTGGGAHPVGPRSLDDWFAVMVPGGRPINPVTKKDWEGVGVVPEVAVPADDALAEALRRAPAAIAASKTRKKP